MDLCSLSPRDSLRDVCLGRVSGSRMEAAVESARIQQPRCLGSKDTAPLWGQVPNQAIAASQEPEMP